jgi:hypothetical protein
MLYGMADSFSAGVDAGLQAKGSITLPLNIKGEAALGNHNWNLSLTGAGDARISVKSPIPHDLLYGEASLSLGPVKLGGSTGSITEGLSTRHGPFVTVDEGFAGYARVRGWTNDVGKIGAHVQIGVGVKFEWDLYKFLKALDDAFDP